VGPNRPPAGHPAGPQNVWPKQPSASRPGQARALKAELPVSAAAKKLIQPQQHPAASGSLGRGEPPSGDPSNRRPPHRLAAVIETQKRWSLPACGPGQNDLQTPGLSAAIRCHEELCGWQGAGLVEASSKLAMQRCWRALPIVRPAQARFAVAWRRPLCHALRRWGVPAARAHKAPAAMPRPHHQRQPIPLLLLLQLPPRPSAGRSLKREATRPMELPFQTSEPATSCGKCAAGDRAIPQPHPADPQRAGTAAVSALRQARVSGRALQRS